ncbi:MAG: CotH kinase family protein [Anaerolineales bacterium]|nr:CotH kinase family protein [Anaerolineales bacterium]
MPTTLLRTTAATLGLAALTMAASLLAGCSLLSEDLERVPAAASTAAATPVAQAPATNDHERPAGWREESHSNDADPNYDVVFPIDAVNMITITLAPDDWAAMQADMEELYGADRDRAKALAAMTDEERAAYLQQQMADAVAAGDVPPSAEFTRRSPIWLPVTISFQGQEWTHVGVRYKGASSLGPWMEGEMKLPFKFDFDEFEDDYPAIKNQRFFGFKQLSLANNYEDAAGMRDTLVYELLADAGLPSLRTAPVEIVLDNGEGPLHLGLYTLIEVVDDTGVSAYFGSDDGNIYEANGLGAGLAKASATQLEASFEKKNNEDEADWSDIRALYDLLHSDVRTSDPAAWRAPTWRQSSTSTASWSGWVSLRSWATATPTALPGTTSTSTTTRRRQTHLVLVGSQCDVSPGTDAVPGARQVHRHRSLAADPLSAGRPGLLGALRRFDGGKLCHRAGAGRTARQDTRPCGGHRARRDAGDEPGGVRRCRAGACRLRDGARRGR